MGLLRQARAGRVRWAPFLTQSELLCAQIVQPESTLSRCQANRVRCVDLGLTQPRLEQPQKARAWRVARASFLQQLALSPMKRVSIAAEANTLKRKAIAQNLTVWLVHVEHSHLCPVPLPVLPAENALQELFRQPLAVTPRTTA